MTYLHYIYAALCGYSYQQVIIDVLHTRTR